MNVIPQSAEPRGTLRSLTTMMVRDLLQRRLKEVIKGHAAHRCKADIDFLEEEYPAYPTTINDEILHEHVERLASSYLVRRMSQRLTRNEDLGSVHSPHSPHFFLDEDVLPLGVALHTALAEIYLNDQWESVDKKYLRIESQGAL
ncbi:hypothetical protein IFM89_022316 [Coptis chinensis]|uniref:Uncharacterized protein n=1 Tax=Coptis chinensis TaxID=261450 RepID=A0A835LWR8_9MAGN|nr:hypothetical protein IFM89_022316 [Coptis chinensis]